MRFANAMRFVYLGLASGLLSSACCLAYSSLYQGHFAGLSVDFSSVATIGGIGIACVIAGLLSSLALWLARKFLGDKAEKYVGLAAMIFSVLTIAAVFHANLPAAVGHPELFPGLVAPMHLFPILMWLTLKPFFVGSKS